MEQERFFLYFGEWVILTRRQVTYLPISSPFIRFAGRYVDEGFGFAAGWNFFVFEAALVPFEVTACNVVIHYWSELISWRSYASSDMLTI